MQNEPTVHAEQTPPTKPYLPEPLAATVLTGDGSPMDPHDAAFDELLHDRLFGCYAIQELRGRGGMGRVYKAWHVHLHRICALKILTSDHVRKDARRLEMFQNEARAAAGVIHPNVVSVHSLGTERGYHYIEMEFVDGPSLGEYLAHQEGVLSVLQATEMVWQLAEGLAAAHRKTVTHGDVKPDNAMLAPDGRVKLTDFGLARLDSATTNSGNLRTGGTPAYMAPELYFGQPIGPATDIYALGITWYQLLTGEVPYRSRSLAEMQMYHATSPIPDPRPVRPEVSDDVAETLAGMLVKDPAHRLADAAAWARQLHNLVLALTDLTELVRRALEPTAIQWSGDGRSFEFVVPLAEGRKQKVLAELRDDFPQAAQVGPILSFWTPCAAVSADTHEYVLKMNSRLPFGGLGIHEYQSRPYYVMAQNHPRRTIDPEEIRLAVEQLAHWGDLVERELSRGKDTH